ncbi:MAG: NfeD family protein [Rhizobiaceae bacterium]
MERIIAELGSWNWLALGLVLLALEMIVPGIFMLWLGLAAIIVGTLSLMFADSGFWPWQAQVIVFLALSIVMAFYGKSLSDKDNVSDEPLLNQRGAQLVGRVTTLDEAIADGVGRIQLDGVHWRVNGPDLAVGTKIRVVSNTNNGMLTVEAA